jgi:YgiT-type zinc finger domain-containing protein
MKSKITKCPTCRSDFVEKQVEKILKGGNHTATVTVDAQVCLHCGERLYSPETIRRFESIRAKLEEGQTAEFEPVGQSFAVNQ